MGNTEQERAPNSGKWNGALGDLVVDSRALLEVRGRPLIPSKEIGKSKAEPQC